MAKPDFRQMVLDARNKVIPYTDDYIYTQDDVWVGCLSSAYAAGLERAAEIVETGTLGYGGDVVKGTARRIAASIRAEKDKPDAS